MSTKRPPLLSDDEMQGVALGYYTKEHVKKYHSAKEMYNASYVAVHKIRDFYEAARAKDAELIQRLVDALNRLVYFERCNAEGLSSGAPTSMDWQQAFDKAQQQIDAAAAAGFKPSDQS